MSRLERLREIKAQKGPDGSASKTANLTYWSNRASENSLHPGSRGKPEAKGPGRSDKNHVSDGESYLPGVRRIGS